MSLEEDSLGYDRDLVKKIQVWSGLVFQPLKEESSFWFLMLFTHLNVLFLDGVQNCRCEWLCNPFIESGNYEEPKGSVFYGRCISPYLATCHT